MAKERLTCPPRASYAHSTRLLDAFTLARTWSECRLPQRYSLQ